MTQSGMSGMPHYANSISDEAFVMMCRIHVNECKRRHTSTDSIEGEGLELVIKHAFRAGLTQESALVVLLHNPTDGERRSSSERLTRHQMDNSYD
jgi:hypothetical protein